MTTRRKHSSRALRGRLTTDGRALFDELVSMRKLVSMRRALEGREPHGLIDDELAFHLLIFPAAIAHRMRSARYPGLRLSWSIRPGLRTVLAARHPAIVALARQSLRSATENRLLAAH
jgi:O-methyltransferase involved in polyketide biosynthesis